MQRAHVDITQDLDGQTVVHALFDLRDDELAASGHAISTAIAERYRTTDLSADEVLELRELTALVDELAQLAGTVVLPPARLALLRRTIASFVESRDRAEWIRDEDRQALEPLREMLPQLERLCEEAVRAALAPGSRVR
jgi:hypothetical protein